jgi:hypothetical protein
MRSQGKGGLEQGAGVEELLRQFEELRRKHAGMDAAEFNDDGIYKAGIIQVQEQDGKRFTFSGRLLRRQLRTDACPQQQP